MRIGSRVWCAAGLLSTLASACGRAHVVDAALHADLPTLRQNIAAHASELDVERTRELAQAVFERELYASRGSAAVEALRASRVCARALLPAIEERAARTDVAAAEATLLLLGLSRLDAAQLVERYASAPLPEWRAVGARAAMSAEFSGVRQVAFHDPDERVRRAALEAASSARDARDFEALNSAMARDPDPLNQSLAVRALGALGGERVVLALVDRWQVASEPLLFAILDAWAMPAAFSAGGERELVRVSETDVGMPKVAAAAAIVRSGGKYRPQAVQVLEAFVRRGTSDERRLAIRSLPELEPDTLATVVAASRDDDPEVRLMALARLTREPKHSVAAKNELFKLAQPSDANAVEARATLAAAGDARVVPVLLKQLASASARERKLAAVALSRLGRPADAAKALADDDSSVRRDVACHLLASSPAS